MSRRNFLRAGLGMAGYEIVRGVLPGFDNVCAQEKRATRGAIIILLAGAMSRLDSFDYKPDAVPEIRGPFEGILATNGAHYSELFPRLAAAAKSYALLPAMHSSSSGIHQDAYKQWLTAPNRTQHLLQVMSSKARGIPYVNAVTPGVIPLFEPERRELNLKDSIQILWDPTKSEYVCQSAFHKLEGHDERMVLRDALQRHSTVPAEAAERFEHQMALASDLVSRPLVSVLDDSASETQRRNRYGENPYGDVMRFAGSMCEQAQAGVVVVETGHWDFHWDIETRMDEPARQLDQALAALIEEYGDRFVICMRGEFGRSAMPETNKDKKPGRGHSPYHAGLIAGPGIEPGIYGRTTRCGFTISDGAVTNEMFAQTLLEATGALPRSFDKGIRGILKNENVK